MSDARKVYLRDRSGNWSPNPPTDPFMAKEKVGAGNNMLEDYRYWYLTEYRVAFSIGNGSGTIEVDGAQVFPGNIYYFLSSRRRKNKLVQYSLKATPSVNHVFQSWTGTGASNGHIHNSTASETYFTLENLPKLPFGFGENYTAITIIANFSTIGGG